MIHKVKHFSKKTGAFLHHSFIPGEHNDHRPQALHKKHLIRYGAALLAIKGFVVLLLFVFPASGFFSEMSAMTIFDAINNERAAFGMVPYVFNERLFFAAREKAFDMIANDYFEHISPEGVPPWHWIKKNNYTYSFAGENLAMDFFDIAELMRGWMDSPSHRANVLNNHFTETAVYVTQGTIGGGNTIVVVAMFGRPKPIAIEDAAEETPLLFSGDTVHVDEIPELALVQSGGNDKDAPGPQNKNASGPQVLGSAARADYFHGQGGDRLARLEKKLFIFGTKIPGMTESLFLYFAALLAVAVLLNVIIAIRVQRWGTVCSGIALIIISIGFALI